MTNSGMKTELTSLVAVDASLGLRIVAGEIIVVRGLLQQVELQEC